MVQAPSLEQAKERLDLIIRKARVDMYKPIQIAETLYHSRTGSGADTFDLLNLDTYKNKSLPWRNEVTKRLYRRASTSSAQYQHNVWQDNAMPPAYLYLLDAENKRTYGAVERYIYISFEQRQGTVAAVVALIQAAVSNPQTFALRTILDLFVKTPGIRRSIDKAYEIVVYSLLETLVITLATEVTVTIPASSQPLLAEFSDLARDLLGLDETHLVQTVPAHIYRAGVTNAADRGLDMWANFGPVIQVKHITLNQKLAQEIVEQVESDNIIIVCKDRDKTVLETFVNQISWGRRVRAIITQSKLEAWYERCLRGKQAHQLAHPLLRMLLEGFVSEFPQVAAFAPFFTERQYDRIFPPPIWDTATSPFSLTK